jgi:hypothetical protein
MSADSTIFPILVDSFPQTLQNLTFILVVNCLAWRNKYPINSILIFRKYDQHALDVPPDLLSLNIKSMGFSTKVTAV